MTELDIAPSLPAPSLTKGQIVRRYAAMSLLVWLAILIAIALESSPYPIDSTGLTPALVFGSVALPFVLATSFVVEFIFRLIGRWLGRRVPFTIPLAIAAVIALCIITEGVWSYLPSHQFEKHVHDPIPPSVRNITVGQSTSFNDGGAIYFGFDIDPADFALLIKSRSMVEKTVDWDAKAEQARRMEVDDTPNISPAFEEERYMGWWDGYQRLRGSRVFIGTRIVAVTDPQMRHVQVMIDYWRDPKTPREP